MRRSLWPALPTLVALAAGQAHVHAEPGFVQTAGAEPPVAFALSKDRATVQARGKWVEKLKRGPSPIPPTNAVEVQCVRKTQSCEEIRAEHGAAKDEVSLTRRTFTVTEWNEKRILARSDTDSADLMLRIFPIDSRVELSYWDTKPQHERKGPADGWVWELR